MTHLDLKTQAASGGELLRRAQILNAKAQRPVLPFVCSQEQEGRLPRRSAAHLQTRSGQRQSADPASQPAFYVWIGLFMCALAAAAVAITWAQLS